MSTMEWESEESEHFHFLLTVLLVTLSFTIY